MQFHELNSWFWQLPEIFHLITFALLIVLYAHLFFGFYMIKKRLKKHVKKWFLLRTGILFFYLIIKADEPAFGMFDLFLPIYIIGYIDGLIILNGFGFHRCQNLRQALKRIFKFRTPPGVNQHLRHDN